MGRPVAQARVGADVGVVERRLCQSVAASVRLVVYLVVQTNESSALGDVMIAILADQATT